jgi:hypothetical protein
MIDVAGKPTQSTLRWFGLIMLVFFVSLAVMARFKLHAPQASMVLVGCGLVAALAFYAVRSLRVPMYLAWMRVFFPLAWFVSHAIVAVIYYLVLTPIGLIMRLVGRDPMRRRFDRNASTYWAHTRRNPSLSDYFKQY